MNIFQKSIYLIAYQIISFQTAILANEKGFNIETRELNYMLEGDLAGKRGASIECSKYVKSSTQTLLQRWLREVHKISVEVSSSWWDKGKCEWKYNVYKEELGDDSPCSLSVFKTYEEALEIGLKEGLKLI